jgi:hypothetical protein
LKIKERKSMRAFALAAIAAVALGSAGAAEARVWNDAQGRMSVDLPRGWDIDDQNIRSDAELSFAAFFTPSRDCYVVGFPNAGTSANNAFEVRRHTLDIAHFPGDKWVDVANGIPAPFPDNSAQFVSQSVDNTNFWPIQRATMRSSKGLVQGGIQLRPGLDIVTFCTSVSGTDGPEAFDSFIRGVSTSHDAELQAAAVQQEADYNAREAAAQAAQQQQQQHQEQNHRRSHDDN